MVYHTPSLKQQLPRSGFEDTISIFFQQKAHLMQVLACLLATKSLQFRPFLKTENLTR